MKVFVAGATGAIGKPLISALLAEHHSVVGMTSSPSRVSVLQNYGAEAVVADALDLQAVSAAIARVRPDAVIEELTSLPKDYTPEAMREAAERDRRVRLEGGGNVYHGAQAASVRRYLVQSTGFFYGPGAGLATETDSLAVNATPAIAAGVRAYMEVEQRVLGSRDMQGVVLRYGFFYGPGTYHDPETGSVTQQVRERKYPVIGSGSGVYSFVHVEDAAAATVAALQSDPGVYNIVDNDASEMRVWLPAFASFLGAPPPSHLSWEDAQSLGPDALYYATRLRGAANDLAKQRLGFSPRRLEWLSKATRAAPGAILE